jgi:hypothetical protein
MVERGIEPYPMVFDRQRHDLRSFARWVILGLYRAHSWGEHRPGAGIKTRESVLAWEPYSMRLAA